MLAAPPPNSRGPPGLKKQESSALADSLKSKTKAMSKRFLVAALKPLSRAAAKGKQAKAASQSQSQAFKQARTTHALPSLPFPYYTQPRPSRGTNR